MQSSYLFQGAGSVLMLAGVTLYSLGRDDGDSTVSFWHLHIATTRSSMLILLIGAILFAFPFTKYFIENFTKPDDHVKTTDFSIYDNNLLPIKSERQHWRVAVFDCNSKPDLSNDTVQFINSELHITSYPYTDNNRSRVNVEIGYSPDEDRLTAEGIAKALNARFGFINSVLQSDSKAPIDKNFHDISVSLPGTC